MSRFPTLSPEEAALFINNNDTVCVSGFTAAGSVKAMSKAIATRAQSLHAQGQEFRVGIISGASTGPSSDGELARAHAVSFRTPYQADPEMRKRINEGEVRFFDLHLSSLQQMLRYGFLGKVNVAVLEVCAIEDDGRVVLTTSVGGSPTFAAVADKVILELNSAHPAALRGFHDIYEPKDPPYRKEVPIYSCSDRCGTADLQIDPSKIIGVVNSCIDDDSNSFSEPAEVTSRIGHHVSEFLVHEMERGRLPKQFLPVQSGVGDIANAVLGEIARNPVIPPFEMYTEVVQDAAFNLIDSGQLKFASTCAMTLSAKARQHFYANLDRYRDRVVMRSQEITNHPEIIRRLGIISLNTAIEVDISGNVNSTHILGRSIMNGIGGSADFTRNAYLSIFCCPSIQKNGGISTIVPLVTHVDHNEHSVQVVVTEYGVADLRGLTPVERARVIINNCAHPDYRPLLTEAFEREMKGHAPLSLSAPFAFHERFLRQGDMRK